MRAVAIGVVLLAAGSRAQEPSVPPPPPDLEYQADDDDAPDLPIEAQRESEEARSASRVSFSASFGFIADPATPGSGGPRVGPSFAFSKPFYMGTRRRYVQFLHEVRVGAGWVPDRYVLLQMSPMWGTNFYFGRYVGLETRLGFGFASKLSTASTFGVAGQGEAGIVLRVFNDDRTRLKLLGGVGIQLFFNDAAGGGLSAYLGAGFETAP